ncbi:MAG: ABC transporter ATP-binding protein [Proteobacteria bacterium]|nr:ABC transporter ATP-binding protein [Pseudomonadota bacterium]
MRASPTLLPTQLRAFLAFFLRRHLGSFSALSALALMWSLEQVLFPYVIKMLVDAFAGYDGDRARIYDALGPALWLGGGMWLLSVIAWRLSDWADYCFSPAFQADIRERMTEAVFGHSHRYFAEHLTGSVTNKIADVVHGAHYIVSNGVRFFIPVLVTALLTAGVMATISPMFAVILLCWTAAHLAICALYSRPCDAASHAHSELRSELQGRIVDSIGNFSTVRLFARAGRELDYIHRFQQREVKAFRRMLFTIAKVKMLLEVPCFIMIVLVIRLLVSGWQQGWVSTGDVAFILSTTMSLVYMLWRLGMEFPAFYREFGVCQQALELVRAPREVTDRENAPLLRVAAGEIRFEDVHFQYHAGQNLFAGKNIVIGAGEKVGLVGFSGSGKSTFVNLILRLYDLAQDSLRAQIALIPQEPLLFHRSLRENLAYGMDDASEADILAASRQAHCHEFIMASQQGYDSIVGERGVKLSGGQRQRIAIGRAILKNAPILIFDEATSSLDSVTEAAIQDSLEQMMRGRTTIVIAHRLSTLTRMDRLLVFRDGAIIEDGTHGQLLARGGHYAALWRMQVGGFLPDEKSA